MNIKRKISLCVSIIALSVPAMAKDNLIIIEDYFFDEIPVAAAEVTGIKRISTSTGAKAVMVTLSKKLPESALKYAIPLDEIPESEEFLNIAKNEKVVAISMSKDNKSEISIGDKFPKFSAKDTDGRVWTNADVDGKVMVLNLWFTGCGPCRSEMPELSQWKNELPDVMFFSATYEDAATAKPILEKQGFNWIALVNDTTFKNWIDDRGYPMTIVVDKSGYIRHIEYGTSPVQRETLKKIIHDEL